MPNSIQDIEGIGPRYAAILKAQGIDTTDKLLQAGATRSGRKALSDAADLSESLILKWVNMCDLFRINGVAGQFAELLTNAGVDTVKELKNRNAENLAQRMARVNKAKHLCKTTPSAKTIARWIDEARALDASISY